MVPLLNLSQKLGATHPYFRTTTLLWGRRNLGWQSKEATSPTTDERLFIAILIYSKFSSYWRWFFSLKVAFSTSSFLKKWKSFGEAIRPCCSLEKSLFFISSATQILLWTLQWWISGERSGKITLMTKFLRFCCWQMLKTFLGITKSKKKQWNFFSGVSWFIVLHMDWIVCSFRASRQLRPK